MAKKRKRKGSPYIKVEQVKVFAWGRYVGAVALDPELGYYVFAYDSSYGKNGPELSPIHMPLNDKEEPFVFTDLPEPTYSRLPAMLADALPDDFGNALIESYMAQKGLQRDQITPLDRLAYMGSRSMGALEFKPSRGPRSKKSTALEMGELVSAARKAIEGTIDSDTESEAVLKNIIEVGTSAGGARAKAVIAWNEDTQEIRSGQVDVPDGFEHWLLKFDGMGEDRELGESQAYGRIEYAYFLMAREAGIDMADSRLLEESGRAHFMTKRFDRGPENLKLHMQTLCALDHLDYKKRGANSYEQLFLTIRKLKLGHAEEVEAFRRMVFNVIGKNCDDHTKNFSFLLPENGAWQLSPAYDVTFAHNPEGDWTKEHLMSINGKFKNFSIEDIQTLADRFGIGEAGDIISQVQDVVKAWPEFAEQAKVIPAEIKRIEKLHVYFSQ